MVYGHNNQLPLNLPQLQNLIKRDPSSYKDEFLQQYRYYKSNLQLFKLRPNQYHKNLDTAVMFLAQVAHCYPQELATYPQDLINILEMHHTILESEMRSTFCRALILMRNKNMLPPTTLLSLFFQLLRCQDKTLRKSLELHIITDIKNINIKTKNVRMNTTLQNFMFSMVKDSNARASKMSVDIMIELYKKNIWNDAKTVNILATACFSKVTKVMVAALKFFQGSDEPEDKSDDSSDEEAAKEILMANKVNRKTRKRERLLKRAKTQVKKNKKKKSEAPKFNFSALHLVNDPQGFAERLLKQLEKSNERFEVKLMTLDIISRLIGIHDLLLFNFYPYVQRFLQPHQREVTRILQFVAQSAHELVPPDSLEPIVRTLLNNFITERNSGDAMAIGLNAVREICNRCPLVMNEDIMSDLAMYRHYKDRSVVMAARSLIQLYRITNPKILHKKNRGRPTVASIELEQKKYGEIDAKSYIPGAEVLVKDGENEDRMKNDGAESDSSGEWEDISQSEDEGDNDDGVGGSDGEELGNSDAASEEDNREDEAEECNDDDKNEFCETEAGDTKGSKALPEKKVIDATEVSLTKIFSDEDFKRIDAAQTGKQVFALKKGSAKKRKAPSDDEEDEEEENQRSNELVSLAAIENIYKRGRRDTQENRKTVEKDPEDRKKFGYKIKRVNPHASKTNQEKRKNKNFMMVRHKARGKMKRSFRDKQIALRNHLIRIKKMK